MADMYGAVRSNVFQVKDQEAFAQWFEQNCKFGDNIELWRYEDNKVAFGGYESYPCPYPNHVVPQDSEQDEEAWDLDELAKEIRQHLCEGEQFRVLSVGNEKLRYVSASHLVITEDDVKYTDLHEGR